jgi:hypothetical protein
VWGFAKSRSCAPAEQLDRDDATKAVEIAIADMGDDVSEADADDREPEPARQGTRIVLPTS